MDGRRIRVIIVVILAVAALTYLISAGFRSNKVYYTTIKEWKANPSRYAGYRIKIGGSVAPGSILRNDRDMQLQFKLKQQDELLTVLYEGVIPDAFQENAEVIVEGKFKGDKFVADNLLTKCASKYEGEVFPGDKNGKQGGL